MQEVVVCSRCRAQENDLVLHLVWREEYVSEREINMTEEEWISTLTSEGYDRVFVWTEGPNETDEDHVHDFDTRIVVLEGEISVTTNGHVVTARSGDTLDTPRSVKHSAVTGSEGCKYIVAEKW